MQNVYFILKGYSVWKKFRTPDLGYNNKFSVLTLIHVFFLLLDKLEHTEIIYLMKIVDIYGW